MRIEAGFFHDPRAELPRIRPVDAIIFDKDLTLTEAAEDDDPNGITIEGSLFSWSDRIRLIHETLRFIREARSEGLRTGLLTNDLRKPTDDILERFGLTSLFDAVIARGEVNGRKKPHPSVFHHMATLLQVEPSRCVMVGDEFRDDIWGAKNAGMKTVLVPRMGHLEHSGHWEVEPDLVLLSRTALNLGNVISL